jgi:hypothetical protein
VSAKSLLRKKSNLHAHKALVRVLRNRVHEANDDQVENKSQEQGDQIGRLFTRGSLSQNLRSSRNLCATVSMAKVMHKCRKDELGYILGDFSQTHLVTLLWKRKLNLKQGSSCLYFILKIVIRRQ